MDVFQIDLYHLRDATRLLPSDGCTVYECEVGTDDPYGIRVKFKPATDCPNAMWKVHLIVDGVNVGYSLPVSSSSSDGFWRARFESVRANADLTEVRQLLFATPSEGTGECGVIECELERGRYDRSRRKPRVEDGWTPPARTGASSAAAASSSASSSTSGTVCTALGKRKAADGFADRGVWVGDAMLVRRCVHYTDAPRPTRARIGA